MHRPLSLLLFLFAAGLLTAAPAAIQIKEASLYAKPTPTSRFLGKLALGTLLTVLDEKDGWTQVKVDGKGLSGWIRTQSYTTKPLNLKATANTGAGVSATEVSLAGRGFTEQIETDYRKKNPTLDFQTLDRLEAQAVPDDELAAFLRDGGVKPKEAR